MQLHGHDIGVCSWSLQPKGLDDLAARVRSLGLNHVQLALAHLADLEKAACDQYVEDVKASGLQVTATMISFKQEDYTTIASIRRSGGYAAENNWPERRTDTIEAAKVTKALDVPLLSTHVGFVPMSSDPQYKTMVDRVGEITAELDKIGVTFLMETGQEPASEMLQFLNDLRVRNVGVNFDPANMILYGAGDPVEAIRILGRHIQHVHVKDANLSERAGTQWGEEVPFGRGDVNPTEFLAALREVGYRGPLVIEREAGKQRDADVKTAIETLRAIPLQHSRIESMQLLHGLEDLRELPAGCALSIGNFDGVHRAHAAIIETMRASITGANEAVAIVTFEPHPLTVLRPHLAPPRLTKRRQKLRLLENLGVTHVVELPPTREVLDLQAEQFWAILRDEVKPRTIVEGPTFFFGKNRGGSVQKLVEWSAGTEVSIKVIEPLDATLCDCSIVEVSSTITRWLIAHGRVRDAARCLGRPYQISGEVIRGAGRGRQIGFPTANVKVEDQLIPADAIYAASCKIAGKTYPVALSIGTNPTFTSREEVHVEAHLIGFDEDLYGKSIDLDVIDYAREQRRYDSVDSLVNQIHRDVDAITQNQHINT